MNEENRIDPNPQTLEIEAPETERTLCSHRLCKGCGAVLAGRRPQAKFCSARCRTAARRTAQAKHLTNSIEKLGQIITALRLVVRQ
jgi:hypothetical protein